MQRDLYVWGKTHLFVVPWLIHMCAMTYTYVWRVSSMCVTVCIAIKCANSYICVQWRIHMCDTSHPCCIGTWHVASQSSVPTSLPWAQTCAHSTTTPHTTLNHHPTHSCTSPFDFALLFPHVCPEKNIWRKSYIYTKETYMYEKRFTNTHPPPQTPWYVTFRCRTAFPTCMSRNKKMKKSYMLKKTPI